MTNDAETRRGLLLAYADSSADLVAPLRRGFEAAGFSTQIAPAGQADAAAAIDAASAVIVCWTPAAVASDVVNLQAARAQKARKLAPILLAPCSPPGNLGGRFRLADLSGWRGDPTDKEFIALIHALHGKLSRRLFSSGLWRSPYLSWGGAGAAMLGAVALIGNFGDLRQAIDGVVNPAASERALTATDAKVEEVLTLLKQKSPQPLSADAEAALRDSIESLLSAQSGARGAAADKLAAGDFEGALADLQAAADEGEKAAQALAETWKEIGALSFAADTQGAIIAYVRATALAPDDSDAHNLLGSLYLRIGNYEEALRTLEQVSWFEEDEAKRAVALGNLGVVALSKGDMEQAELYLRESLEINERLDYKDGQAADLADLSDVVRTQGNSARANGMLQRALKLYTETDNLEGQSNVQGRLGAAAFQRGQFEPALAAYRIAADLSEQSGDLESMISAQLGLGDVASATGKLQDATGYYTAALELARSIDARKNEAESLSGLGDVARKQNDKTAAIERYRDSMTIYIDIGVDQPVAELRELLTSLGATPSPEGPEN